MNLFFCAFGLSQHVFTVCTREISNFLHIKKKHVEYFLVDLIIANLIDNQASIVLVTQI